MVNSVFLAKNQMPEEGSGNSCYSILTNSYPVRILLRYLDKAVGVRSKRSNMGVGVVKNGKNDIFEKSISSWIFNIVMLTY